MGQQLLEKHGKKIYWKYLTLEDTVAVEKLMTEYCQSEPLCAEIGLTDEMKQNIFATAENLLSQGMSIGAYDQEKKDHLCSICLVGSYDPANFDTDLQNVKDNSPLDAFSAMTRFTLEVLMKIKEVTHESKFLHHKFSITDTQYRNMGIMTNLQKRLIDVARQHNYRCIAGVYSSEFTIRLSTNLGFKLLGEVIHNQYVDPLNGEQPFKNMVSHNYSKAMYYDVESGC